ncbi:unnamed protein product [Closterium sp. NIES-53]
MQPWAVGLCPTHPPHPTHPPTIPTTHPATHHPTHPHTHHPNHPPTHTPTYPPTHQPTGDVERFRDGRGDDAALLHARPLSERHVARCAAAAIGESAVHLICDCQQVVMAAHLGDLGELSV